MNLSKRWGAATGLAAMIVAYGSSDALARVCSLSLHLDDAVTVGALQLAVGHQVGVFHDPPCTNAADGAVAAFSADQDAMRLDASFVSLEGMSGPVHLADCTLDDSASDATADQFNVVVVEATDVSGVPLEVTPSASVSLDCDVDTSTTTTTLETRVCDITLHLTDGGSIASLDWRVDYSAAPGGFAGAGSAVECTSLLPIGTLSSYKDDETTATLKGAMIHNLGIDTPRDIARCRFIPLLDDPVAADFETVVTNATDNEETPADPMPALVITDISCDGTVPSFLCGDANDSGTITATDALRVLEGALGTGNCPPWLCDTDSNGSVLANDALRVLRAAIGLDVTLVCPDQD